VVALKSFVGSSIEIEILYWIRQAEISPITINSKLILQITQSFKAAGIEIAYPQQELLIKGFANNKPFEET
jgi:small-conductance mechanosensitive channel